jgi:hypothetical protein
VNRTAKPIIQSGRKRSPQTKAAPLEKGTGEKEEISESRSKDQIKSGKPQRYAKPDTRDSREREPPLRVILAGLHNSTAGVWHLHYILEEKN